ncbi:transposase [Branchiibius sp. NY16-3462-2]|uniref:transposase n=1 Tax=Branchiibius sp. NY16-3462-2 TaxID=1807500 RepID=UPI0025B823BC|nr:transposase [Branchiibius sp. NY16-3462-2]
MPEIRKKYDREFREGAVRIVEETGKPIAQVARDLGVNEGTLGNWVTRARADRDGSSSLSTGDYEELKRLGDLKGYGSYASTEPSQPGHPSRFERHPQQANASTSAARR